MLMFKLNKKIFFHFFYVIKKKQNKIHFDFFWKFINFNFINLYFKRKIALKKGNIKLDISRIL